MSTRRTTTHAGAVATALLVTLLWSSSWILIRRGLDGEGLRPLTFAALRYALAAIVLTGWLMARPSLRRSVRAIGRSMWLRLAALGLVFYAATQGAQFVAIANQPAATTSVVLSLTPLLVAAVASAALSEAPTPRQVAGAVLVVAGAWLYFAGDLGATAVGMAAALTALLCNVASALLGRHVNRGLAIPAVVVTAVSMAAGAVCLLAVGFAAEGMPAISPRAWLIVAWLALVNTALAFTLWNLSLRRLSALESAAINNTMLLQIGVLAWVFLGEQPGVPGAAGMILVAAGVFLAQASGSRRAV
jgi:drug/metabolite transporter (DMT)-like permease